MIVAHSGWAALVGPWAVREATQVGTMSGAVLIIGNKMKSSITIRASPNMYRKGGQKEESVR